MLAGKGGRMIGRSLNLLFLFGLFGLWVLSGSEVEGPGAAGTPSEMRQLAEMEETAAASPTDIQTAVSLADRYLALGEPDLAIAIVRRAGAEGEPAAAHRLSIAYERLGRLTDALATERTALYRCWARRVPGLQDPATRGLCGDDTYGRIDLHLRAVEAMHDMGVVDPGVQPERARRAYDIAYRVVRVALQPSDAGSVDAIR